MSDWFALQVQSGREKYISSMLQHKGIDVCLLLYRSVRHWSDREKALELAAFPGYVLCSFDPDHRVPILSTPGVVSIVGCGRKPVPIPREEIDALRLIERSGQPVISCPYLAVGQEVWIEGGVLNGLQGKLLENRKQSRVVVSVQILQRSVAVEIDIARVRPCSPQVPATPVVALPSDMLLARRQSSRPLAHC